MNTATVLRNVAARLTASPDLWKNHFSVSPAASGCAIQQISKEVSRSHNGFSMAASQRAQRFLRGAIPDGQGIDPDLHTPCIVAYNDAPERTVEEVIAWFTRAAEAAEREEENKE